VRDSDHEDHKGVIFLATKRHKRHKKAKKVIEEWSHFFFESGIHELRKTSIS
jgi:hypothetical protein